MRILGWPSGWSATLVACFSRSGALTVRPPSLGGFGGVQEVLVDASTVGLLGHETFEPSIKKVDVDEANEVP